ncbi:cell adhesion molecule CEACAM1-like isoform X2 [Aquarana catesbeiana]|uniref:cell adhesion molecule CEACAM1-like isoform X2 n=1 Tax=Aquarana catesbeiana TaxID=8400 RepID=UPI003CCA28F7
MACAWFLLSCVLLLHIVGAGFAYQVENGIVEGSVTFHESLPIHDNPILRWTFKNALIAWLFPRGTPTCVDQYAGRCTLYENGTLRLNSLTFADDGNYTMTARYLTTSLTKESTYGLRIYTVLGSPALHCNDTSNSLISGTSLSIYCNASSLNVTTYTFYRDGKNICSKPHVTCQDSYLYFQPITESDSGNYTCTIQNPVSSNTSTTLHLKVAVPVSDVKLASNATGLVWPGIDVVSLTCSARGTDVTYSWSLQGAPLPQNPQYYLSANNTVLTIRPITANDNGTFTCTASNWINNETSNGVIFNLASLVSAVTLTGNISGSYIWVGEDSVSLNCSADGSNVTFFWNLNGEPLPKDSRYQLSQGYPLCSNLLISPVSRSDSGPFICGAYNMLSIKNSSALNLNLAWNPEASMSCNAVNISGNAELGCSWPGGHPAANVSLIFNGVSNNGQNSVTRVMSKSGNFQGSNLTCFGDQLGRTSQCSLIFEPRLGTKNENSNVPPPHTYSTIIPGTEIKPGMQQPHYENRAMYSNLEPSTGKR